MRFLLLLVCVAFTGCHANLARRDPPQPQVDMVKDAFWDYVAKATRTAEDSLRQIRESELGRDVNSLISQSTDAVNKFTDALQTQVAPATSDLLSGLSQEAERLRARVEQQLAAVEKEATPLATELAASLQRQAEQLRSEATPLAAALQQNLAPYGEELKEQLDALWDAFTHMVQ